MLSESFLSFSVRSGWFDSFSPPSLHFRNPNLVSSNRAYSLLRPIQNDWSWFCLRLGKVQTESSFVLTRLEMEIPFAMLDLNCLARINIVGWPLAVLIRRPAMALLTFTCDSKSNPQWGICILIFWIVRPTLPMQIICNYTGLVLGALLTPYYLPALHRLRW